MSIDARPESYSHASAIAEILARHERNPMPKTLVLPVTPNVGATASLVHALEAAGHDVNSWISEKLDRHFTGDWGDLDAFDKACNEAALISGDRILSRYNGEPCDVYVITDMAIDEVRFTTTIMRPEDY